MMTKMTKKLTIILYLHLEMGGQPPLLSRLPLDKPARLTIRLLAPFPPVFVKPNHNDLIALTQA